MEAPDRIRGESAATLARPAAVVGLGIAAFFGLLRSVNAAPAERSAEWLGEIAMACAYATPSLLTFVALRSRRVLLLSAGVLAAVLSFTAFSGISLVLLIPAGMFFAAYRRASDGTDGSAWRRALAIPLTVILGLGSFFVLFVRQDQLCWSDGCTSDTITALEAVASLFLAISCLGIGAWLARPALPSLSESSS